MVDYYRKFLFGDHTLQDLPADPPRIVLNATNVKTGSLWRFSRPYMGDYQVGLIAAPTTPLAVAVAASSAFPPFLSPLRLELSPDRFTPETLGPEFGCEPYTTEAVLTDGGVYDNLGLETAWKHYQTILVSDGGRKMAADPEPANDWGRHSRRLIDLLQNQTSNLRPPAGDRLVQSTTGSRGTLPSRTTAAKGLTGASRVTSPTTGSPIRSPARLRERPSWRTSKPGSPLWSRPSRIVSSTGAMRSATRRSASMSIPPCRNRTDSLTPPLTFEKRTFWSLGVTLPGKRGR